MLPQAVAWKILFYQSEDAPPCALLHNSLFPLDNRRDGIVIRRISSFARFIANDLRAGRFELRSVQDEVNSRPGDPSAKRMKACLLRRPLRVHFTIAVRELRHSR